MTGVWGTLCRVLVCTALCAQSNKICHGQQLLGIEGIFIPANQLKNAKDMCADRNLRPSSKNYPLGGGLNPWQEEQWNPYSTHEAFDQFDTLGEIETSDEYERYTLPAPHHPYGIISAHNDYQQGSMHRQQRSLLPAATIDRQMYPFGDQRENHVQHYNEYPVWDPPPQPGSGPEPGAYITMPGGVGMGYDHDNAMRGTDQHVGQQPVAYGPDCGCQTYQLAHHQNGRPIATSALD